MRWLAISMLLSACGGSSAGWAGNWRQPPGFPVGSYVEATLGQQGTAVTGSGIQHREAGPDVTFTVSGSTSGITLTYGGGSTESFSFSQPDENHLVWSNSNRTVPLTRQ